MEKVIIGNATTKSTKRNERKNTKNGRKPTVQCETLLIQEGGRQSLRLRLYGQIKMRLQQFTLKQCADKKKAESENMLIISCRCKARLCVDFTLKQICKLLTVQKMRANEIFGGQICRKRIEDAQKQVDMFVAPEPVKVEQRDLLGVAA